MARANFVMLAALAPVLLLSGQHRAQAAESYDSCTAFVSVLPTVISSQGTYCLRSDLSTAITSGNAIDIQANNVTIDCNHFALNGLPAGPDTQANGISTSGAIRDNAIVRHCSVRGFHYGISLGNGTGDGAGYVVENNRLEGNTYVGISVFGDGSIVRRNLVINTGGSTLHYYPNGIVAAGSVDILDNTISGVKAATGTNGGATGLGILNSPGSSIVGNRVRGLSPDGTGPAYGIDFPGTGRIAVRHNDLKGSPLAGSIGVRCNTAEQRAKDNVVNGFTTSISSCGDAGGNDLSH